MSDALLGYAACRQRLESLLLAGQPLWRPQPFKQETPLWAERQPEFAERLLGLDEAVVDRIEADPFALIELVQGEWPELAELRPCIDLPMHAADACNAVSPHRLRDIPGRKQEQIRYFAAAIGEPLAPLLEWCAGKGHLGRILAHQHGLDVLSLEIDPDLCRGGLQLAARDRIADRHGFICADALNAESSRRCRGRHALALHACGELHRRLVRNVVETGCPALDLAPCCYYRGVDSTYQAFMPSVLKLTVDDLRLAVTQTVTASTAQRRRSRQAQAWKLAWVALANTLRGSSDWRAFRPVPDVWYRHGFGGFIERMARREGLGLPARIDLAAFEAEGWRRAARMRRFGLVRHAFRRPLELWLAHDMAAYLESHGYRIHLAAFCPQHITPRNIHLAARRLA